MRTMSLICLAALVALMAGPGAHGLTIYDVQYSTGPDYQSPYYGQTVSVTGGVVTKIFVGGWTKITIQDPTLGDAWAGIQVLFGDPAQAEGIERGDQIDVFDVTVDEYRGNTQLIMEDGSTVTVNSSGNVVDPVVVSTTEIPYPANPDLSEPYEYMLVQVQDVCVGAMDIGSHEDNYELTNGEGVCWASDYANADLPPDSDYYVEAGDCFESVTGYLEQYDRPEQGWNYYQILPRDADDYIDAPSPAEADSWGGVKSLFR